MHGAFLIVTLTVIPPTAREGMGWDSLLKIKKSRVKEEWIVYNPDNFALHTHCKSQRVAVAIKRTVETHSLPKSTDKRFIDSCIRVTHNKVYLRQLQAYRDSL